LWVCYFCNCRIAGVVPLARLSFFLEQPLTVNAHAVLSQLASGLVFTVIVTSCTFLPVTAAWCACHRVCAAGG
jgi:hypothetical protein